MFNHNTPLKLYFEVSGNTHFILNIMYQIKSEQFDILEFIFSEIFGEMRQMVNLNLLLFLYYSLTNTRRAEQICIKCKEWSIYFSNDFSLCRRSCHRISLGNQFTKCMLNHILIFLKVFPDNCIELQYWGKWSELQKWFHSWKFNSTYT